MRATMEPQPCKKIFCLVHAEKLTNQVAERSLVSLSDLTQGRSGIQYIDSRICHSIKTLMILM